jgi:hypothetical protein
MADFSRTLELCHLYNRIIIVVMYHNGLLILGNKFLVGGRGDVIVRAVRDSRTRLRYRSIKGEGVQFFRGRVRNNFWGR